MTDTPAVEDVVQWWDSADDPMFHSQVMQLERRHDRPRSALSEAAITYLEDVRSSVPRRIHRAEGYHPSEMGSHWCARQAWFKRLLPIAADSLQFNGQVQLRFQMGNAAHYHWQNAMFGKMRVLRGRWQCSRCLHEVQGLMPRDPCAECGWPVNAEGAASNRGDRRLCATSCVWPGGLAAEGRDCAQCERGGSWLFKETRIRIPEWEVVGSCDGELPEYAGEKDVVLELKSKDPSYFPLSRPEDDHVVQANIYMWGLGRTVGLIVYINKSTGETTEFLIRLDPKIIEMVQGRIQEARAAILSRRAPNGICGGPRSQDAQVCPYAKPCFTGYDTVEEIVAELARREALGIAADAADVAAVAAEEDVIVL